MIPMKPTTKIVIEPAANSSAPVHDEGFSRFPLSPFVDTLQTKNAEIVDISPIIPIIMNFT